jgi:plastocyanin
VNGCDEATAEDHTGQSQVTISFGGAGGFVYTPACIKVTAGTMVTFMGSFSGHPLAGGNNPPTVDPSSPIVETTSGTQATFILSTAGAYGYFCEFHYPFGMEGAIFVQ